jgi:hypothetical protein
VTPGQLQDGTLSIWITEGEKKGLALWRLANHNSEVPRFVPVAIAGVWNWRGKIAKSTGPQGQRIDVKGPIPDLDRIEWKSRKVSIVFDSNVHSNESVAAARRALTAELQRRRAQVHWIDLPCLSGEAAQ